MPAAAAQVPQESATFLVSSKVQAVLDVRNALQEYAGTAGKGGCCWRCPAAASCWALPC
jgi:hypothetical protein